MPFINYKELKYYTFSSIGSGVRHGVFTRHGGVSPSPWCSLNMGATVGDDDYRVRKNRQAGFDALNLDISSLFDVWQIHGTNVVHAENLRALDQPYQKADIILTDKPGVTLMMRFADCTPIILHDPIRKVIGLVHAGWMGTVDQAASKAIEAMIRAYGSDPGDILAGIGPSIGPDHYEVGGDVESLARKTFAGDSPVFHKKANERIHFDLWTANKILLERSGVNKIEIAHICTVCHLDDWFSHRGEKGITGRFGAMISLEA